jgi:hypothetical protein
MPSSRTIPFNIRVFISSTFSDLQEYRRATFEAIQSLGAHGDDMIYWSADERSGTALSLDGVRQCDVVILLRAHRYGYVPSDSTWSVTEMEYSAAREAGVPVLAYFLDDSQPWPPRGAVAALSVRIDTVGVCWGVIGGDWNPGWGALRACPTVDLTNRDHPTPETIRRPCGSGLHLTMEIKRGQLPPHLLCVCAFAPH